MGNTIIVRAVPGAIDGTTLSCGTKDSTVTGHQLGSRRSLVR
jgi:hypothetical protein